MGDIIDIDWSRELAEQLDWHWREQPRPRPDGLTADFAGLARPCGPAEPFPDAPMASLVLHINREVIHHGAEIALLRDLYRWRFGGVAAPGAGG
jgi:hypothetical protein